MLERLVEGVVSFPVFIGFPPIVEERLEGWQSVSDFTVFVPKRNR